MTGCRRAAIVVFCISLVSLALSAGAGWLRLPVGDAARGFLAGLGVGGLFLALLLWFTPGGIHDSAPKALARRYYREFFPPMAAYTVVMLFWGRLLRHVDATWLRTLVALLPALLVALAMRAIARYVRDSDEMQRRIELESVGIAAGLVSIGYMTAGFLQSAKLIAVSGSVAMLMVFPAICMVYGIAKIFIARRYA